MITPVSDMPFQDYQYSLRRTTEPSYLPVTLTDAREALKFGTTTAADDREIENNLFVAVELAEDYCQRSFANQGWTLKLDCFPSIIELWRPPIISVDSLQYIDINGTTQTWAASNYDTDLTSAPGRIVPSDDSTGWPTINTEPNAVIVTFTAGYGAAIPERAKKMILLALRSVYHNCDLSDAFYIIGDTLRWEGGL